MQESITQKFIYNSKICDEVSHNVRALVIAHHRCLNMNIRCRKLDKLLTVTPLSYFRIRRFIKFNQIMLVLVL